MTEEVLFNFEEHKTQDKVSIAELNQLCEYMFQLKGDIESKEAEVSEMNKSLEDLRQKVLGILTDHNLDNFNSIYGRISTRTINTFKINPEQKEDFFKFLKARDAEHMLTVNHQTLQAFCRELYETNKRDLDFSIPGVGEPKAYTTLTMRKG